MNFQIFGNDKAPTLLLIPGLGVSYEIFLPLIRLVEERFRIIAVEVDGFTLGTSAFRRTFRLCLWSVAWR